ncbi:MAG: DUF5320 domain-containing protein [Bacteroidales bacterium]
MPGYNQTGPLGQGPMTGRKMGRCTNFGANRKNVSNKTENNSTENSMEIPFGKGRGMGYGRGFGRGLGRQSRFNGGV